MLFAYVIKSVALRGAEGEAREVLMGEEHALLVLGLGGWGWLFFGGWSGMGRAVSVCACMWTELRGRGERKTFRCKERQERKNERGVGKVAGLD